MRRQVRQTSHRTWPPWPTALVSLGGLLTVVLFAEGILPFHGDPDLPGWGDWGWSWIAFDSVPYGPLVLREWVAVVGWLTTGFVALLAVGSWLPGRPPRRRPRAGTGVILLLMAGATGWVTGKYLEPDIPADEAVRLAEAQFRDGYLYGTWVLRRHQVRGADEACRAHLSDDDPTARFAAALILLSQGDDSEETRRILRKAGDDSAGIEPSWSDAQAWRIRLGLRYLWPGDTRPDRWTELPLPFRRWWTGAREDL
jgi:hypothetical protein